MDDLAQRFQDKINLNPIYEDNFAEKDAILMAKQAQFKNRKNIIVQKEASLKKKEESQTDSEIFLK